MKILTTQNLSSLSTNQPNCVLNSKNDRFKMSENIYARASVSKKEQGTVSFKGNSDLPKRIAELIKKISNKKVAGDKSMSEKLLRSDFFDGLLDLMTHETFIQSAISFLICVFLRPLTIMSIPTKKSKEDNKYASAHAISSGFVGLASSVLIAIPFSKGLKYAQKNMIANLRDETLKKMFPHLDLKSIVKNGKRITDMDQWKDIYGNKFHQKIKDVMLIAKPIHATEISEKTFEKFGIKLNKTANKDKPFAEWICMDGKRVVEKLDIKDFCIAIKEDKMGESISKKLKDTNFFSLKYIGDDLLEAVCKDLDMKSTRGVNGERLHPTSWKNKSGKPYTEILDATHLSSYIETAESVPLFSSSKRLEQASGKYKYISHQPNIKVDETLIGVPSELGSPIKQESLDADKITEIQHKLIVWLPDILSRPIVATATIALLPKILKNVFHLEKPSKKPTPAVAVAKGVA